MDMMGFDDRLYLSYKRYNGVGGKGIDKMIAQLIAKHDELPALPTERRLPFFHRGIGGAPESAVDRWANKKADCYE
jgi:hypothetical protein